MAGKLRIKISCKPCAPFWMFVNTEECPQIIDIQTKIEQRLADVNVDSLYLDGCLLPANETTEVLRDNDSLHVKLTEGSDGHSSSSCFITPKPNRKRKHEEEDSRAQEFEIGAVINSMIYSEKKKNKKAKQNAASEESNVTLKHQHKKDTLKKQHKKDTLKKQQKKDTLKKQHKKDKEKRKIQETKSFVTENVDSVLEVDKNGDLPGCSTPALNKTCEAEIESNTESFRVVQTPSGQNSTLIGDEVTPTVEKKKRTPRKRHQKRKRNAKNEPQVENDSKAAVVKKPIPTEFRLPKGQKAQNKKIVFSSDEESPFGSNTTKSELNSQETVDGKQHDKTQTSGQTGVINNSSSFSEAFPEASPSISRPALAVSEREGNAVSSVASHQNNIKFSSRIRIITSENKGDSLFSGMSGVAVRSVAVRSKQDEWNWNKQYQENLNQEKNQEHQSGSAINRATNPVHLYASGHNEAVQPNLVNCLKMSPQERGVKVPPYVTAQRLSNGAMLYKRSPVTANDSARETDYSSSPSSFKKPAAYTCKASPGQQQQLDTYTNKAVVFTNSPVGQKANLPMSFYGPRGSNADGIMSETNGNRADHGLSEAGRESGEVIILTPLDRDYTSFPDLVTAPKVGDTIAYKVLEMGDNYTPGISDYKEAEVLGYDPSSQNVHVKLFQTNTKTKTPGRFDLPDEEAVEDELTIELSSMFEPKLLSAQ